MTGPPINDILACPRCSFRDYYTEEGALSPAEQQAEVCAYCAENLRRARAGLRILEAPTAEFPTATPEELEAEDAPGCPF